MDFAYSLAFEQFQPGDQVWDYGDLQVMFQSSELNYLNGLVIDYSEDMMGGGFRFSNPNADRVCGCGNSFSVI